MIANSIKMIEFVNLLIFYEFNFNRLEVAHIVKWNIDKIDILLIDLVCLLVGQMGRQRFSAFFCHVFTGRISHEQPEFNDI